MNIDTWSTWSTMNEEQERGKGDEHECVHTVLRSFFCFLLFIIFLTVAGLLIT